MTRWMGVDLGSRRIGIALSDDKGRIATPYATLPRTNDLDDAKAVSEMAHAEGVKTVVLGLPLTLEGERAAAAFVTEAFASKLKDERVTVRMWDERLTTAEADKKLKSRGMKGKQRRAVIDKMAAAGILQSFLDARTKK